MKRWVNTLFITLLIVGYWMVIDYLVNRKDSWVLFFLFVLSLTFLVGFFLNTLLNDKLNLRGLDLSIKRVDDYFKEKNMSENDINRWRNTITPSNNKEWKLGSGGSWDTLEVQPIPDEMLAELAQVYNYSGAPWNCRSLPLSSSDREYMFMLYYSMQGLVARIRLAEKRIAELEALPLIRLDVIAEIIHYPHCWDVAAYPTVESALGELYQAFKCNECGSALQNIGHSSVEQLSELLRGLEASPGCATLHPRMLYEIGKAVATQAKKVHVDADKPSLDSPVNHKEAEQFANLKRHESNLARCYLDLLAKPNQMLTEDVTLLREADNYAQFSGLPKTVRDALIRVLDTYSPPSQIDKEGK